MDADRGRPPDPAAQARRKADLLLASALAREQAGLALDTIERRVGRVEARVAAVRERLAGLVGDGTPGVVRTFAAPLVIGAIVGGWWRRRRRRARAAAAVAARSAGGAGAAAPAGGGLALAGLLAASLPRLWSLWRWSGHGRRAWRLWRTWKSARGGRAPPPVRR